MVWLDQGNKCLTVHPIEHELSAFYDITHGVGLGILTPRWMKFVLSDKTVAKFARFGRNVWSIQDDDDQVVAEKAIQATYDWLSHWRYQQTCQVLKSLTMNTSKKWLNQR